MSDELMGQLTARQQEIATLISRGMSNKQIAERLFLAEGTIKNKVYQIFQRLGFQSRVQIATMVIREELAAAIVGRKGHR